MNKESSNVDIKLEKMMILFFFCLAKMNHKKKLTSKTKKAKTFVNYLNSYVLLLFKFHYLDYKEPPDLNRKKNSYIISLSYFQQQCFK